MYKTCANRARAKSKKQYGAELRPMFLRISMEKTFYNANCF